MKRQSKFRVLMLLAIVGMFVLAAAVFLKQAYVVPVLMYHSIDCNDEKTKLSVSPRGFASQMERLHKYRYNVVGLDKVAAYLQKKAPIPPRTVAVTLDDGFKNNYTCAYPALKKYNIPATIFVIVSKIGTPGYLDWKELKEMSDSGIVTIGSHTISHLWLPAMGTQQLSDELLRSKQILEDGLGRKVDFLCYPMGAHDARVKEAARRAGYMCAVGTNTGKDARADDLFAIKRIRVSRTSYNPITFFIETSGYYTWFKERRDD